MALGLRPLASAPLSTLLSAVVQAAATQGLVLPQWIMPGVGPNPARVGRQFAFMGSTFIPSARKGIIAVGSSGGFGGGIGTSAVGSAN